MKSQSRKQDLSLHTHIQIITGKNLSVPKLQYSLACVSNTLAYTNSNRHNNIEYLLNYTKLFAQILESNANYQSQQQCVVIINVLLSSVNQLTLQDQHKIMNAISYTKGNQTNNFCITDRLAEEILKLTYRVKFQKENSGFIAKIMAEKMTVIQVQKFIEELKKQELKNIFISQLIKIGNKFKNNQKVLSKILKLLYWKLSNNRTQNQQKQIGLFLSKVIEENVSEQILIYECLLLLKSTSKKVSIQKNMQLYAYSLLKAKKQLYLPLKNQFIKSPQQLIGSLEYGKQFQIYHFIIMDYLVKNNLVFREDWKNALMENNAQKNIRCKEIMLRICGIDFKQSQNGKRKSKCQITLNQELSFLQILPIQSLRCLESIVTKLQLEPSIQNCLYIIQNISYYPKQPELLLFLHKISLKHKQYPLISQIQKIILQQIGDQFVFKKLKQKDSWKQVNQNKGKLFFIWAPLLIKKKDLIQRIQDQLSEVINYETIDIQQKFYILEFLLLNKLKKPLQKFLLFILRLIQSGHQASIYKEINYYIKKSNLKQNTEVVEFLHKNFQFQLQRVLQTLFSKTVSARSQDLRQIIFELQKWHVYDSRWSNIYRWIITALQQVSDWDHLYTLDCLEIFQMIIQKIKPNDIPRFAKQRFFKSVFKNWIKYQNDHFFAIQRIYQILCPNKQEQLIQFKLQLPSVQKLMDQQIKFNKNNTFFFQAQHPTSLFIVQLTQLHFFDKISQSQTIKIIIELYDKKYSQIKRFTQNNVILLLNFLLWMYQYSQQEMNPKINEMLLTFMGYKGEGNNQISSFIIRQKCIQIISLITHSINLLKLPIKQLLQTYILQADVIRNINQILGIIIDSKPKALQAFNLQNIIQSIILSLITIQDLGLAEQYVNLIETICYIQNSKYSSLFQDSIQTIYQIVKCEIKTVPTYRKQLVLFVLNTLVHYQFVIQERLMWFLINKYFVQEEIIQILLQQIMKLYQKQTKKLYISNEELLVRVILHHNDKQNILKLCREILKKAQKQKHLIKIKVNQEAKTTMASDSMLQTEHLFNEYFQKEDYDQCLHSIPKIRDPYKIKLTDSQISKFLLQKHLQNYTKLIDYLLQNPSTRRQMLSDSNFYVSSACANQILTLRKLLLSFHQLARLKIISINKSQLNFQTQKNQIQSVIHQAFVKVFKQKECLSKMVLMGKQLNVQQKYQLISFYSMFSNTKQSKIIINEILSQWKFKPDWQYTKLYIPYQISDLSNIPIDYMLRHLQVHLNHIQFTNTPQQVSLQSYLSELTERILSQSSLKQSHHIIYETFINQPKKRILSKVICQNIKRLFERVFTQIAQKTNTSINDEEFYGILSMYLFLLKCRVDYKNGLLGKTLNQLDGKIKSQPFMRQAYTILIQQKLPLQQSIISQKIEKQIKQKTIQNNTKVQENSKTQTKQLQQKKPIKVQPPQSKVQEQAEIQQDKQVSQAYSKCRKIQPQVKVITQTKPKQTIQKKPQKPQKVKAVLDKKNQSTKVMTQNEFGEDLIKPKQDNFNQNDYYLKGKTQDKSSSKSDRQALLKTVKDMEKAEISITTLKQHIKYITLLNTYATLSLQEILQLIKSLDSITETVLSHHYYVKKVVDLQATYKLIQLYRKSETVIQDGLKQYRAVFQTKLLNLHHAMSFKKQKKTILFNDEISIDFFKLILKKSLKQKQNSDKNKLTVQIISYCIKSIDNFFRQGLISMLIQLLKCGINHMDILCFFNKIDLSRHIIYQMYQRGMLNKMLDQFNQKSTNTSINSQLNLWVRLAAKICINKSIQQKYVQFKLHQILWKKQNQIPDIQGRKNIAFFYSRLCHKNQIVCLFLIQNQIMQSLLNSLQHDECEDLYMLFFNFCQQNKQNLEFVFRIKYHLHLIQKLTNVQKVKSKFFFKSLGQIMTHEYYQPIFFKEQIVQKLTESYQVKPEPSIYQCLLDFICTLKTDKEFQQLKKQNFWNCLTLFEYKLSSEATYAYILQIFLIMIGKGRIKEFNQAQLRGKVALKSQYSINLEGKQLAVKFIVALSAKTKENYLTQRCVRLLASIVGLKTTIDQLDLIQDMLTIEGTIQNIEFLGYFDQYQITSLLCNNFNQYKQQELLVALRIFNFLSIQTKNNKIITQKLLTSVIEYLQKTQNINYLIRYWALKLILISATFRNNAEYIRHIETGPFLTNELNRCLLYPQKQRESLISQFMYLVQTYQKNSLVHVFELEKIVNKLFDNNVNKKYPQLQKIKQNLQGNKDSQTANNISTLQNGAKVKMYKQDGSSSDLVLYLTEDKLQLNCAVQKGQAVKQKWRMPLNQIEKLIVFQNDSQYQKSAFYKSSGFFTNAPNKKSCLTIKSKSNEFNILFDQGQNIKNWMECVKFAMANAIQILNKVK